jgi:hypothetical protein
VRRPWDYLASAIEYRDSTASVAFAAVLTAEHAREGGAADERERQAEWLYRELELSHWFPS